MDEVFVHRTSLSVDETDEIRQFANCFGRGCLGLGFMLYHAGSESLGVGKKTQARARREQHAHHDGELEIKVT